MYHNIHNRYFIPKYPVFSIKTCFLYSSLWGIDRRAMDVFETFRPTLVKLWPRWALIMFDNLMNYVDIVLARHTWYSKSNIFSLVATGMTYYV